MVSKMLWAFLPSPQMPQVSLAEGRAAVYMGMRRRRSTAGREFDGSRASLGSSIPSIADEVLLQNFWGNTQQTLVHGIQEVAECLKIKNGDERGAGYAQHLCRVIGRHLDVIPAKESIHTELRFKGIDRVRLALGGLGICNARQRILSTGLHQYIQLVTFPLLTQEGVMEDLVALQVAPLFQFVGAAIVQMFVCPIHPLRN
jgi:hypothetical protein